jgi:hypothetical protein
MRLQFVLGLEQASHMVVGLEFWRGASRALCIAGAKSDPDSFRASQSSLAWAFRPWGLQVAFRGASPGQIACVTVLKLLQMMGN